MAKLAPVVFGDANEADVLAQGGQDRFANPPDGEGDELVASLGVEAPGGLEQAEIALVEKILERQSQVAVLAGDLGDESEVGLDQVVEGLPVPFAGTAGQADLFLATERSSVSNVRDTGSAPSDLDFAETAFNYLSASEPASASFKTIVATGV